MNQTIFANLRNVLAKLFPDALSIRRIVEDAALDQQKIDFSSSAINIWHFVLAEAEKVDRVEALLRAVENDGYGNNQAFQAACAAYRQLHGKSDGINLPSNPPQPKGHSQTWQQRLPVLLFGIFVMGFAGCGSYWMFWGSQPGANVTPAATATASTTAVTTEQLADGTLTPAALPTSTPTAALPSPTSMVTVMATIIESSPITSASESATTLPQPTATAQSTSTPTVASAQLCSFAFLVLDDQSEEPIRRATIAVFVGVRQDTGTTDSTGYYLAKLPCSNGQAVEARVRVSADDYDPYNRSLFLSEETTEILLEHKATPTPIATLVTTSIPKLTVTTVSIITATLEPTVNVRLRLLIPLYSYPNWWEPANYFWDEIAAVNSQIPIIAIINPNNGPDEGPPNNDFLHGLNDLRDAGVTLLGYVHSSYGSRLSVDVQAEIDLYDQYYDINGIFIDEVSNDVEQVKYYQNLYQYVHSKNNLHLVVLNPGTNTDEIYVSQPAGDVIVIFEDRSSALRDYNPDDYVNSYPSTRFAMLAYAVPDVTILQTQLEFAIAHNIGYVYLTDDILPNPWDAIPSFWDSETALIQQLNAVTRMPTSTSTPQPTVTATSTSVPAYPCEAQVKSERSGDTLSNIIRSDPGGNRTVTKSLTSGQAVYIHDKRDVNGFWYLISIEKDGYQWGWLPEKLVELSSSCPK